MVLGWSILVEGDLDTRYAGIRSQFFQKCRGRVMVLDAVRAEQDDAESIASLGFGECPPLVGVELYQGVDPALPVEVRPLIGKAQVDFDYPRPNGLEIDHSGVTFQVIADPISTIRLDPGPRRGQHRPVIELTAVQRRPDRVPPPGCLTVHHREIGTNVFALEQWHPHVAGPLHVPVLPLGSDDAAARTHASHVVDGLAEHGKRWRCQPVRCARQILTLCNGEFVVDPLVLWVPLPGIPVLGWNSDRIRALRILEILHSPWIGFANWHVSPPSESERDPSVAVRLSIVGDEAGGLTRLCHGAPTADPHGTQAIHAPVTGHDPAAPPKGNVQSAGAVFQFARFVKPNVARNADYTHKISANGLEAFDSPGYPPRADIGTHIRVQTHRARPTSNGSVSVKHLGTHVVTATPRFPGVSTDAIRHALSPPYFRCRIADSGLVRIRIGNACGCWKGRRGVVIVAVSQCVNGVVNLASYAARAARAKLRFLFDSGLEAPAVRAQMGQDWRKELSGGDIGR